MLHKKITTVIIGLFFLLILITSYLYFNKKQVERDTTVKSNSKQTCSYLDINDDNSILKNKFDYYILPDAKSLEQVDLKEFLIKDYYPNHNYSNDCLQKNACTLENSDFKSTEIDLNNDGKKESVIIPWKVCNCEMRGASGNGDILILRANNNKFEVIGNLSNSNGYVILKKKTNGYSDILTNSHSSAATGTETLYKYQTFSNGMETNGEYEEAFTKWYDLTRVINK